jgi:hypothetical protein
VSNDTETVSNDTPAVETIRNSAPAEVIEPTSVSRPPSITIFSRGFRAPCPIVIKRQALPEGIDGHAPFQALRFFPWGGLKVGHQLGHRRGPMAMAIRKVRASKHAQIRIRAGQA